MAQEAGPGWDDAAGAAASWASGHPPPPSPPPLEGQGPGRRRWPVPPQQHQQHHRHQHHQCHASPAFPSPAAAAAAAKAFPAPPRPSCPAAEQRPGMGPRVRRGPRRRPWRWLAAGLTCCTLLALYASSCLSSTSLSLSSIPSLLQDHLLPHRGDDDDDDDEIKARTPVTVLLWWQPFGRSRRLGGCQRHFGIPACHLTSDQSQLLKAQAVLFHHRDLVLHGTVQLPPVRPPSQRWVWMNFESPSHSPGLQELRGIFNWTMSYKVDSDVFVPYGYLRPRRAPFLGGHLPLPKKTKLVAWVISNWDENQARVRYYHQLKNHLPIDIYGAQGLDLKDDSVVQTVSQYKFYLAFENSQHPDYITEKLWRNAFKSWAVPVTFGPPRSNYELFIPSSSFIHVDDFSDPRQLALYLKFLDKNKSRYRKYFAWRKHYDVQVTSFWNEHYCRVCNVVRAAGKQRKTIQNLAHWFES